KRFSVRKGKVKSQSSSVQELRHFYTISRARRCAGRFWKKGIGLTDAGPQIFVLLAVVSLCYHVHMVQPCLRVEKPKLSWWRRWALRAMNRSLMTWRVKARKILCCIITFRPSAWGKLDASLDLDGGKLAMAP